MTSWETRLTNWEKSYDCKVRRPLDWQQVQSAALELRFSNELTSFYRYCNGLALEWFSVLPIKDCIDIKHTWDGLNRANNPDKSRFIDNDKFLNRFLIFASLDAGRCAVIDRNDGSIWYEEDEEFYRLTSHLADFIETCLREVVEL